MRFLFVRHGESEANVAQVFSNRGWRHPLTVAGRQQAQALAEILAAHAPTAIYASPLQRAVETAEILAERLKLCFEIEPALIEYDVGIYEGCRYDENGAADCYRDVARQWADGIQDARMSQGESCREIHARFRPFIQRLLDRFGKTDATLILVGHGGTYRHALPLILPNLNCAITMSNGLHNAAYAEAEFRDGALHCVRWGDISFE
jgi:broad specificity phosphatase PhoE